MCADTGLYLLEGPGWVTHMLYFFHNNWSSRRYISLILSGSMSRQHLECKSIGNKRYNLRSSVDFLIKCLSMVLLTRFIIMVYYLLV